MGIYKEAIIKIFITLLALFIGLGTALWDTLAPPPVAVIERVFPDAPDFTFAPVGGSVQKLSDLRGKTVLVNVWATWCAPCVAEMPDLLKIAQRDDIELIALSVDERPSVIKPFFDKLDVEYKHAFIAHDRGKEISRDLYAITLYPETIIVSPEGKLLNRIEGVIDWLGPEGQAALNGQ